MKRDRNALLCGAIRGKVHPMNLTLLSILSTTFHRVPKQVRPGHGRRNDRHADDAGDR